MQREERFIQSWSFGECSGLAVVNVEVVAPDTGGEEVLDLPVGVLGFGGYAGVADQFGLQSFEGVS